MRYGFFLALIAVLVAGCGSDSGLGAPITGAVGTPGAVTSSWLEIDSISGPSDALNTDYGPYGFDAQDPLKVGDKCVEQSDFDHCRPRRGDVLSVICRRDSRYAVVVPDGQLRKPDEVRYWLTGAEAPVGLVDPDKVDTGDVKVPRCDEETLHSKRVHEREGH